MSEHVAMARAVDKSAKGGVLVKLVLFAVSLAIVPLLTYYASSIYLYGGNTTYAALTAVFSANTVLVVYIITSIFEDTPLKTSHDSPSESTVTTAEDKKQR
ncbi:hypothetical protein PUNSTDRAFT_132806 [Punctularia strigosozonata HHB-11173 SS5]|uniref:uncharacterized protein n=1 Tax=Punctularia strigosozonata (strain HHB-11173) TaxID=741275 RepID=UPI000441687E|nr:uncharacterized protein PUNSTDRAFT_132806 [Punctularia strigosozonata HHB-11173 SS5]EIN10733.1 hypothetical protein PUNSTDRAFT_132806 [Punctularia strigosozonata HHB-11173 SS5]